MIQTNYPKFKNQMHLSDDSLMRMEPFEHSHLDQFYKSSADQLLCWGEESTYLDSEFCKILEGADRDNLSITM